MFKFTGFTAKANKAVNHAISKAESLGHSYIGSEHLLLGLLLSKDTSACIALTYKGITAEKIEGLITKTVGKGGKTNLSPADLTPRCKLILESAVLNARKNGFELVGTEHILIAILEEKSSYAVKFLSSAGLDVNGLLDLLNCAEVEMSRERASFNEAFLKKENQKAKTPFLNRYGTDLNKKAENSLLDPVFLRDKEIKQLMEILSRRSKNNPIIIGEAGVGKTAIIEGLAQKIVLGECAENLIGKRIISLDLGLMISGSKYRGEFEDRLKNTLKEVENNKNIILFIDEIHTIVGAGSAEGAVDAANILKPSLARGEITIIGATTINEYRKYIEKDQALARRFQKLKIEEPTMAETITILNGLCEKFESYHNVKITDEAISKSVELSARFIGDRKLPDKAIDILDQACAMEKIMGKSFVTELSIENALEELCGIDTKKLTDKSRASLLKTEEEIEKIVIGQNNAVKAVTKAVLRGKTGIADPLRPVGSFLFLGPTGVGKTELSKALAKVVFGSEKKLFTFDMTEYSEKSAVSKLIGTTAGYVGYEDAGILTETVKRNPSSVILFDELEKAGREVHNLLLGILEEGFITDGKGERVSFRENIIIMTSNIGSSVALGKKRAGFSTFESEKHEETIAEKEKKSAIQKELREHFSPEFLGRIDEVILFDPLSQESAQKIVLKLLSILKDRLKKQGITLSVSENAVKKIAKSGFDKKNGARPLRKYIREEVENPIADMIVLGEISENQTVMLTTSNNSLCLAPKAQNDFKEQEEIALSLN